MLALINIVIMRTVDAILALFAQEKRLDTIAENATAEIAERIGMTYREPNGIPDDVSDQVQVLWGPDELGRSDWHTPTHWTLEDLDECHREGTADYPSGDGIQRISEMLQEMWRVAREYNLEPDQVRVVLWYDN
jgi:hypothetical protein